MIRPHLLPPAMKGVQFVGRKYNCGVFIFWVNSIFKPSTFFMTGREKGGKARAKSKTRSTDQLRAYLQFPVGRVHCYLKPYNYSECVGASASVYLAAVMEYLVTEILELVGNRAQDKRKLKINSWYLQFAIKSDKELSQLLSDVIFPYPSVFIVSFCLNRAKRWNLKNSSLFSYQSVFSKASNFPRIFHNFSCIVIIINLRNKLSLYINVFVFAGWYK